MNWYFDTSVLIAAAVAKHPHHVPAAARLEELAIGPHQGFLSTPGLAEVYSVLTRLPLTPRIHPSEAHRIIEDQILPLFELVTLDAEQYKRVIRRAATEGCIGGLIHDAVQLQCAVQTNCDRVYTFNLVDFRALAPPELTSRIVSP